jgi:hypothetical protein
VSLPRPYREHITADKKEIRDFPNSPLGNFRYAQNVKQNAYYGQKLKLKHPCHRKMKDKNIQNGEIFD